MAEIRQKPEPVKPIVALLAGRVEWLDAAAERVTEWLGPIDITSPTWPFTFTHYYDEVMGPNLLRRLVSFERLIDPGALASIKRRTNALEAELTERFSDVPRPVNIDPGYVTSAKLVLASAKDFSHRIYLADGIFAEVTLTFRRGRWESLPSTFPDYASGLYDGFLNEVRQSWKRQLHGAADGDSPQP